MIHKMMIPKQGVNVDEAKILRWYKSVGEAVKTGDPLAEVETSKSVSEVLAETEGILVKILHKEEETVRITDIIGIIASPDETEESIKKTIEEIKKTPKEEFAYQHEVYKEWKKVQPEPVTTGLSSASRNTEVRISPRAKKLIKERGLSLEEIKTKLTRGSITGEMVERLAQSTKKAVIYGAGLGAKQVVEITRNLPDIEVVGLLDDDKNSWKQKRLGYSILGGFDTLFELYLDKKIDGVILSFHSEVRKKLFLKIKEHKPDLPILPLVDPRASVGMDVEIEEGVFIEAGAIIGPGTKLKRGAILDVGVVICHDCHIGEFSHLSPGCILSGVVNLTENVMVGVGASINSCVTVGKNVLITPGSGVMNDVEDNVIVSGIPAVVIGKSKRR